MFELDQWIVEEIWNHIYPSIVGLTWREDSYRRYFRRESPGGLAFRISELERVGHIHVAAAAPVGQ